MSSSSTDASPTPSAKDSGGSPSGSADLRHGRLRQRSAALHRALPASRPHFEPLHRAAVDGASRRSSSSPFRTCSSTASTCASTSSPELPRKVRALIDFVGHPRPRAVLPVRHLGDQSGMTSLFQKGDRWETWKVWDLWEQSPDAPGLPRAPIKVLLFLGFVFLAVQTMAELIKLGFVMGARGPRRRSRSSRPTLASRVNDDPRTLRGDARRAGAPRPPLRTRRIRLRRSEELLVRPQAAFPELARAERAANELGVAGDRHVRVVHGVDRHRVSGWRCRSHSPPWRSRCSVCGWATSASRLGALPSRSVRVHLRPEPLGHPVLRLHGSDLREVRSGGASPEAVGRLMGPLRGGLGLTVVFVGTMLRHGHRGRRRHRHHDGAVLCRRWSATATTTDWRPALSPPPGRWPS